MKIFVCEFITGGGLCRASLSASLAQEGALMRNALLHDLMQLAQLSILVSYDQRLPVPVLRASSQDEAVGIGPQDDAWVIWQQCIERSDLVWVIAPETHGYLSRLSRMVLERNKTLIGSTLAAIALTSSKFASYEQLKRAGINTIATYRFQQWLATCSPLQGGSTQAAWVAKLDDGAGAEDSAYFEDAAALSKWMQTRQATHVIQPYHAGHPASISVLCKHGQAWVLSCNAQMIRLLPMPAWHTQASRFDYAGSLVNGMARHWLAFAHIAQQIAQAIPGLAGYVGIDVLVQETLSGEIADIHVLEINPRLTTSYVALHEAMGHNPAKLVLDLLWANADADGAGYSNGGYNAGANGAAVSTAFVMPTISRLPVEVVLHA